MSTQGTAMIQVVTVSPQAHSSYASRVPPGVLKALRIVGAIQVGFGMTQIAIGVRSIVGGLHWWSSYLGVCIGVLFTSAGMAGFNASGGVHGRDFSNTLRWVIASLVLSLLSLGVSLASFIGAVLPLAQSTSGRSFSAPAVLIIVSRVIFIIAAVVAGLQCVVALVQSALSWRASCCCVPAQPLEAVQTCPAAGDEKFGQPLLPAEMEKQQPQLPPPQQSPPPAYLEMAACNA